MTASTLKPGQKRKKLFWDITSEKNKSFDHIELCYSAFMWVSGNHPWFCRIWAKNWLDEEKMFGESYGRNKFEAYRLALNDLRNTPM